MTIIIALPNLRNTLESTKQLCVNSNNLQKNFFAKCHRLIKVFQQFQLCFFSKEIDNFFINLTSTTQILLTVTKFNFLKYQLKTTTALAVKQNVVVKVLTSFRLFHEEMIPFTVFLLSTNPLNTI